MKLPASTPVVRASQTWCSLRAALVTACLLLCFLPGSSSFHLPVVFGTKHRHVNSCKRLAAVAPRMQQGDWSSPGGDNRHDIARGSSPGSPQVGNAANSGPGREGSVGQRGVGGSEMRMEPGARRMTPGERIHYMGVPMQTGIVSNEKDAKGMSQKQVLQETISAGDDWWAGDTIDLSGDPNALAADWVMETTTSGQNVYRNKRTGLVSWQRPKRAAAAAAAAAEWETKSEVPRASFGDEEPLLNLALWEEGEQGGGELPQASLSETQTLMRKHLDTIASERAAGGEEAQETRTLIRQIVNAQRRDDVDYFIQKAILDAPAGGSMEGEQTGAEEGVCGLSRAAGGRGSAAFTAVSGGGGEEGEGGGEGMAGTAEDESLLRVIANTATVGRQRRETATFESRTNTILRRLDEEVRNEYDSTASIQRISAEGEVLGGGGEEEIEIDAKDNGVQDIRELDARGDGARGGGGGGVVEGTRAGARARRLEEQQQRRQVPEHLRPGNNAGQMNWAERQLAKAQQGQRPISDLPGFAANYLKGQAARAGGEGASDEYVENPTWNPGLIDRPVSKRRLLKTADEVRRSSEAAEAAATHVQEPAAKTDEQQMDQVLGLLFENDLEVRNAQVAGSDGRNSWELLESSLQGIRPDEVLADPDARDFTFVDEHQCIGCYNCAMIARNTFFMEEEHGRARVFRQKGDSDAVIDEAIESCPVVCIHAVTLDELKQLEEERAGDVINNKSRLVGGSYTAEEKGGTPWLRLQARRAREGKGTFLGM